MAVDFDLTLEPGVGVIGGAGAEEMTFLVLELCWIGVCPEVGTLLAMALNGSSLACEEWAGPVLCAVGVGVGGVAESTSSAAGTAVDGVVVDRVVVEVVGSTASGLLFSLSVFALSACFCANNFDLLARGTIGRSLCRCAKPKSTRIPVFFRTS